MAIGEKPHLRRLGDAAVVFDPLSWETHVLPPAAAVVAEIAEELSAEGPVSAEVLRRQLREEFQLDCDTPEMRQLLRMMGDIGMLEG
ncbi:MAG: HPr-rel-A system PqqD family peptide chaperone [Thauera phenolivorans]|uniref:HPr-rel-A system PqqD family peptide chaperone n=1 Tax=Thauera phenolivorans TaxID=1792543 RepID=A0A7X7LWW9_9RHOO|nr:HPr-rel-A system PqqD family peptide chaperone [Thauera phenolivorans]NLF54575.1 HPr-rel-A system PqqD family peptide chaperone [Thauera phenolivorans]